MAAIFLFFQSMSCLRARGHIFSDKNLIFWLRTPWDMSKKVFFSDFQNFDFYDNRGLFRCVFYVCSRARGRIFALRS